MHFPLLLISFLSCAAKILNSKLKFLCPFCQCIHFEAKVVKKETSSGSSVKVNCQQNWPGVARKYSGELCVPYHLFSKEKYLQFVLT